ncbi:periaxin [Bombina bombina]|uniref:periaxin n=1 Tax=Bombina bombina TaxID=8345 RepID=UPI00235A77E0|nr:periaxin [Bombina bombina]
MESQIIITEEKLKASEMVEVIMETEAQTGISGINISGGGKEGLFVADISKDSPAAKLLPLLEGDQLLSARVYFENIKYEDALKILQIAENYKVSFCLKRTMPPSDVTISQSSGTVEIKGPKAKMPKLTVKNLTPVKKKKKKAPGEVKVSEEASIEAIKGSELSVGNMDIPPVDVEFSFPKFSKFLKTKGTAETGVEEKSTEATAKMSAGEQVWAKMKFPRLRVKEATAAGVSTEVSESKATLAKPSIDAEAKEKSLAAKFGISATKMKKPKVDILVPKAEVKVSPPKVEIEAREEKTFKPPQVELDVSLPSMKAEMPEISLPKIPDVQIKVPTSNLEVEAPAGKISMSQISKAGICLPQVEKESEVAVKVEGKSKTEIKIPSVEIAAPTLDVDLSLPKVEGAVKAEPSDKSFQIKLPKFGISTKTHETDLEVSIPQVKKDIEMKVTEDKFKMPSVKAPEVEIYFPKGREEYSPDEKKVSMKLPSLDISAPKLDVDISLPKGILEPGASEEFPDVTLKMQKISPPKVGMKVKDAYAETMKMKWESPKVEVKVENIEAESSFEIPDASLKMPKISLPKFGTKEDIKAPEAEVKKGKVEGWSPEFKLKAPTIKMPSFGISLSKEKQDMSPPEVEVSGKETKLEADVKQTFSSIKMPSLDISLPKVQDFQPGKLELSGPTIKTDIKEPGVEITDAHDLKFKMPKVSLSKIDMSVKPEKPQMSPPKLGIYVPRVDTKTKEGELETKGDKITLPKVDFSIPKIKPIEIDIATPKPELDITVERSKVGMKIPKVEYDAIAFKGETGDLKFGLPSVKMPALEIDTPKLDFDLNLPKVATEVSEPSVEGDSKIQMPKLTLHKLSDVAKDMAVEIDVPKVKGDLPFPPCAAAIKGTEVEAIDTADKGFKISLPKVELELGKSSKDYEVEVTGSELKGKSEIKLPKVKLEAPEKERESSEAKIKLPSVKLPSVEITTPKIPDIDIDTSVPKIALDVQGTDDVSAGISETDVKWKAPKFSFRKLGISGPKSKKGINGDGKPSHLEGEVEATGKGIKMKMPKFGITFPKTKHDVEFETSKVTLEADVKRTKGKKADVPGDQVESSEGKLSLPSVKLPSLNISAPKLEVDIDLPKGHGDVFATADKPSDISIDIPEVKLNLPKFSMPKFGSKSKGSDTEVEIQSTKEGGKGTLTKSTKITESSVSDIDVKVKGKEGKIKMPSLKMPSFGSPKKDSDVTDLKLDVKTSPSDVKVKKVKAATKESKVEVEAPEGDVKTSFIKMPSFKMSPPKIQAPDVSIAMGVSKEDIRLPDVHVKVPQVELPSLGIKEAKIDNVADLSLPKPDAKLSGLVEGPDGHVSEKIKMPTLEISALQDVPSLEISVPCSKPDICITLPKAVVDVSDADIKGYEGDLKIPKLSSFGVSVPSLDISLPKAKLDTSLEQKAELTLEKTETKIKMPKVEFSTFGDRALDAKVSTDEAKYQTSEADAKFKGHKIKLPHFDISLPKIRPDDEDIPFIEGEGKMHGTSIETTAAEGTFNLPSVELPKMSTPKIRAPELELDISLSKDDIQSGDLAKTHKAELSGPEVGLSDLKFKMPKMKLPKFGGSGSGIDEETAKGDVKSPKLDEGRDSETMGFKIKMPKLQVGSLKDKSREDTMEGDQKKAAKGDMKVTGSDESEIGGRFKIKMPSFGISKDYTDTEPLHPTGDGDESKFKISKISIPDVGFSRETEVGDFKGSGHIKGSKSSSIEDLELDIKIPKIKMPSINIPGRRADDDMTLSLEEDLEVKKSPFKMPNVEISSPKIKAHGEYDVDGAQLEDSLSRETQTVHSAKKGSKLKDDTKDQEENSGKKFKVKLPTLGVSLPKPVAGDVELFAPERKSEGEYNVNPLDSEHDTDHHEGNRTKKNIFSLVRSKDKTSGLLTSDADNTMEAEGPEVKIKMPKIKMKPSFGLSRGKGKGAEVNGEFDVSGRGEAHMEMSADNTTKSSKIKLPKLGFSSKANSGDFNGAGTPGSPTHINGENQVAVQNGSQDGGMKIGKLKLPKVEFTSPYKGKESDSEINLKLVKTEEPDSKEEGNGSLFTGKFKSPKITFSGFKKKDKGEDQQVTSAATTENVGEGDTKAGRGKLSFGFLSSKSKGEYTVDNSSIEKELEGESGKEKSAKYKLPKLYLSPKMGTELEITTETQEIALEDSFKMPNVGFTTHQEEHTTQEEEVTGGFLKITKTKHIKTETVTEKTVTI